MSTVKSKQSGYGFLGVSRKHYELTAIRICEMYVVIDEDWDPNNVGHRIILSSLFTGGPHYMHAGCYEIWPP